MTQSNGRQTCPVCKVESDIRMWDKEDCYCEDCEDMHDGGKCPVCGEIFSVYTFAGLKTRED
jgi:hypothetical protein